MFKNISGKIKALAEGVCLLGIIGSVLAGGMIISEGDEGIGLLVMLIGAFLSWISSFVLYGFGQLIENTDIMANRKEETKEKLQESSAPSMKNATLVVCPSCGAKVSGDTKFCNICGKMLG
ncbi:MAG: zinc ribbon domain-containing protein [Ruminococcaceae bacterium]|nr:zinc ribbon domain-containing protein [Oscillospiraceae bacterium]